MTYQSETLSALAPALSKFQGEVDNAKKRAKNDHFKNKYADLAEVWDTAREHLAAHGLSVVQLPMPSEAGRLNLRTTLLHASGEWIASEITMPLGKSDPQGYGSAMTYARRYALAAILGIAQEDDDGNAATQGRPAAATAQAKPAAKLATPAQANDIGEQVSRVGWGAEAFKAWTKSNARGVAKRTKLTADEADALLEHLGGLPDREAA